MGLAERAESLPTGPGVYLFKGSRGKVVYVGKAKSLRKRAASYLRDLLDPRLRSMVAEAREVEFVVTATEAEALLLENNWIKTKQIGRAHV